MRTKTLLVLSFISIALGFNNVVIQNLKLFDGNTEFFIKGMCYSPAPLGFSNMSAAYTGGVGLCSDRQQYAPGRTDVVTTSACAYDDFFDGSVYANGPAGPWFKALWDRDFPVMQQLGVNTIRIYHTNPITKAAVAENPTIYTTPGLGVDHIPFMDQAAASGFKVIFPMYAEQAFLSEANIPTLEAYIRYLVDEVGNHSALLMWQVGNELPIFGPTAQPGLVDLLNHLFDYTRNYTLTRWNRIVPVSNALVDYPPAYNGLTEDMHVDVLTTNAGYRGPDYSNLWTGSTDPNVQFYGMQRLSCAYNKPVFIGEIGQHSTDGFVNQYDWFTRNWKSLMDNIANGAIGGAFFEYSNEMWKATNQQQMGVMSVSASANSLSVGGWTPDVLTQRPNSTGAYAFSAVATALNTDVWTYLGRQPYTLTNVPSICTNVAPLPNVTTSSTTTYSPPTTSTSTSTGSSNGASSGSNGSTGTSNGSSNGSSGSSNGSTDGSSNGSSNGSTGSSNGSSRATEGSSSTTVVGQDVSSSWMLSIPVLAVAAVATLF
eukprot:TRINITY_DN804_c0_g1_i1.p1 TRINITY_DN804_c0_g1~~TRINITY_DN804_c0_g1_i1.p1  ORF type:complete len:542 (-),score=116.29 TRINITY_DN804_c0_g1_i1:57-1682(-)